MAVEDTFSVELFRQELPNFRSVKLHVAEDGKLQIDTQDMGEAVNQMWGDDDYEYWVDVPAAAAKKLLFALARDKFAGHGNATDLLRDFCQKEGITFSWESWT